ncbi:acetyl-CoA acetyltransferase [Sphingomonas sp. 28-62-11]|uniref:acetyl-CoA acetyltransferase n=1 Tax=Sphingomonas sp. 28-62-11 TaxID=1970432 RepID=UPI000BCB822A|nr:MAG: acetyl-CoA acetyltransferase [Sphingomonas sp. 28-62-11]
MDAARTPVIIGVGQINDRTEDPFAAMDPVALMVAALQAADCDGGGGWIKAIDSLAVVDQISFREMNPLVDAVAAGLGIAPAHCFQTAKPMGDSPVRLLNEAANRIGSGESIVAAVVGAEALRTAAKRAAANGGDVDHNAMRIRHKGVAPIYRQRYGLTAPVDVYPLYENATRSAWGQTLAEAQAESGRIWALFSQVATDNPNAWLRAPKSVDEIVTPSPANRPIAFPYPKLMVANSAVNQGAGFIVTSLAQARARGFGDDRLIFVGHGAAAHEPDDVLARDGYAASAGMRVSLEQTLAANGLTFDQIDLAELYSCFPCVPKMARRIIGWPEDRPASVVGGLTFGGGPIGNYMSHAIAAMVDRLRGGDGQHGLLFGNGGFATYNHSIVLSRAPIPGVSFPHNFDHQAAAEALRGPVPIVDQDYAGPGVIETYTVFYDREGAPSAGVVVARNPVGDRFLARVPGDDDAGIAFLTNANADPIGTSGIAVEAKDGLLEWLIIN